MKIRTICARIHDKGIFCFCDWTDRVNNLLSLSNLNESLIFRDEDEKFFLPILCFKTRTRKSLRLVEQENIKLILAIIPRIENSR